MVMHLWITKILVLVLLLTSPLFYIKRHPVSHRPGDAHSELVESIWHNGSGYGFSKSADVHTY